MRCSVGIHLPHPRRRSLRHRRSLLVARFGVLAPASLALLHVETVMKILEVDQWTSGGDFSNFKMEDFERDPQGSLLKIKGGDAEAVRGIFGGHAKVRDVYDHSTPSIGHVWLREMNGKLEVWKTNYDSSD